MDGRQFPRIPLVSVTTVASEQHSGHGVLLDLSQAGAKLSSEHPLQPSDYVALNLSLPFQEPSLQVVLAAVRWVQGRIFGVEFIQITHSEQSRLKDFLDSQPTLNTSR
jgi:PilZ domain-containing protein